MNYYVVSLSVDCESFNNKGLLCLKIKLFFSQIETEDTNGACTICLMPMSSTERYNIRIPNPIVPGENSIAQESCAAKHGFHKACIEQWLRASDNPSCPICRTGLAFEIEPVSEAKKLRLAELHGL